MKSIPFQDMLENRWAEGKFVCVGLDLDYDKIPDHLKSKGDVTNACTSFIAFAKAIINATHDLVCAYKPNTAFYEAYGSNGIMALQLIIAYIKKVAPGVAVILDAKRADIGNTNIGYNRFAFGHLLADAVTLHPYLGREALQPFLEQREKGIFILCRTSNPGAGEFQDLHCQDDGREVPLFQAVARHASENWNKNGNCGLVVGATYPQELADIRALVPDLPFLIPGIGAQGGDVEKTVKAGKKADGTGMIINSSRGVLYASSEENFAQAARAEVEKLQAEINKHI